MSHGSRVINNFQVLIQSEHIRILSFFGIPVFVEIPKKNYILEDGRYKNVNRPLQQTRVCFFIFNPLIIS